MTDQLVLEKIRFTNFGAVLTFSGKVRQTIYGEVKTFSVKSAYNLDLIREDLMNHEIFDDAVIDFNSAEITFSDGFLTKKLTGSKWINCKQVLKNQTYRDSFEITP